MRQWRRMRRCPWCATPARGALRPTVQDVSTKPQPEPEPQPQPQPQPEADSKEAKTSEQLEAYPVETQEQLTEMEEGVPTKPEPEPEPQAYSKEAAGP